MKGDLCGQFQKFPDILTGDIGHALDFLFQPEMIGIIQIQQFAFFSFLFADGIDDQPTALSTFSRVRQWRFTGGRVSPTA